ncbi:hypothetical protein B0H21DRAFT_338716 [Amylocystis lapponica]|nr:hypothetical protein B0H21DRAFT_338716 [Amylocystis lapponica]
MPSMHHDPRLGDEVTDDDDASSPQSRAKHVRLQAPAQDDKHDKHDEHPHASHDKFLIYLRAFVSKIPIDLSWMSNNWSWSKLKPVIRCAVFGWVSLVFMIILRTEVLLGQASFLVVIAALLDPPRDPFMAVLERELIFGGFVTTAWAWSCLGIFLGNLARKQTDPTAPLAVIITGAYLEAAPTVIMAIFLFIGVAVLLFVKVKKGPGPFVFPCVFGCICIDICITTAALFPYPYYIVGRAIVLPIIFHCALSIFFAAVLFPSTITARYADCIVRILEPLNAVLAEHRAILKMDPNSPPFPTAVARIEGLVNKSEGGLPPAAATLRLLKQDIIWGRFSPVDIGELHWFTRRLVTRANGMGTFFTLIEPTRERFPITPIPSRPSTPVPSRPMTPRSSRPSTPQTPGTPQSGFRTQPVRRSRLGDLHHASFRQSLTRKLHLHLRQEAEDAEAHEHHRLHLSLLHLAHALQVAHVSSGSPNEVAVGVFESQRYLALESTRLARRPDMPEATDTFIALLGEACDELLGGCADALKGVQNWIAGVRHHSFGRRAKIEKARTQRLETLVALKDELSRVLEDFRKQKRHRVLDPYRSAFDPKHVTAHGAVEPPPHRYLFHCYMYQYHLMQFGILLVELLSEIIRLENAHKSARLWTPRLPLQKLFHWSVWDISNEVARDDDEDPDVIQGANFDDGADLGSASRRDPDALPPQNLFQAVMNRVHHMLSALAGGNALFALKAGLLTIILCIPSFLKSSANFAYEERFVWGITRSRFMGQLTLARFRGETTFALVARIMSTFLGGLCGMVIWYISAGSGHGDPYGLAAVCAVCFPFMFFWRLYWPGPPMTNAIFFVTVALVLGYSWQDTHDPFVFHWYGFALAWRRFVLVTGGVVAAFLFSFLPPSTTLRRYQRTMLSTTAMELGTVYCSIVSFANTRRNEELDRGQIIQSLLAIRMKLKRSLVLKTNIIYEFSLRGQWPAKRYQTVLELQMQIAFFLSHLMSVVEHLEPAWSRAFLRRTRFLDSDFQGDVLAVISMVSTALRTGNPLPQITPCPLLDRFMVHTHGLNVIRQEADDDYGLPRTMTIDTLENEQYLCFSVGVTTAFGIVMRLDKLMVATKELVGEQYHIHGIGVPEMRLDGEQAGLLRPSKDA